MDMWWLFCKFLFVIYFILLFTEDDDIGIAIKSNLFLQEKEAGKEFQLSHEKNMAWMIEDLFTFWRPN